MQQALWHESFEEALLSVVAAIGGPKVVASQLWPTKEPRDSARYLNHCLDPERPEKLSLSEVVWILREGARSGCHIGMQFLAEACMYERPRMVTKEEKRDELQRQFVDAVKELNVIQKKLDRLS